MAATKNNFLVKIYIRIMKLKNVCYYSYFYGLFNGCLLGAAYTVLISSDLESLLTASFWIFVLICVILGFYFFIRIPSKQGILQRKPIKYNFKLAEKEYKKKLKLIRKLNEKN